MSSVADWSPLPFCTYRGYPAVVRCMFGFIHTPYWSQYIGLYFICDNSYFRNWKLWIQLYKFRIFMNMKRNDMRVLNLHKNHLPFMNRRYHWIDSKVTAWATYVHNCHIDDARWRFYAHILSTFNIKLILINVISQFFTTPHRLQLSEWLLLIVLSRSWYSSELAYDICATI